MLVLASCVTRLETVGDWSRPSELSLSRNYLKGIKIQVQCGMIDKRDRLLARRYPICRDLQDLLNDSGAIIVGSTDPSFPNSDADLHFFYLDTGKVESSQSGLALAGFIFTGGLVPLVFTGASEAEFRIVDKRGITIDRAPMKIAQIRAFGWGALGGLFGPSLSAQKKEVSQIVFHYAKNRLASQALRLEQGIRTEAAQ